MFVRPKKQMVLKHWFRLCFPGPQADLVEGSTRGSPAAAAPPADSQGSRVAGTIAGTPAGVRSVAELQRDLQLHQGRSLVQCQFGLRICRPNSENAVHCPMSMQYTARFHPSSHHTAQAQARARAHAHLASRTCPPPPPAHAHFSSILPLTQVHSTVASLCHSTVSLYRVITLRVITLPCHHSTVSLYCGMQAGRCKITTTGCSPTPPPPGAATIVALLPLWDAAALLAKASGSGSQAGDNSPSRLQSSMGRKDSGWLIGSTRTLPCPCSASPPPALHACRALTLHASPAFQVLFGARDSPACDVVSRRRARPLHRDGGQRRCPCAHQRACPAVRTRALFAAGWAARLDAHGAAADRPQCFGLRLPRPACAAQL